MANKKKLELMRDVRWAVKGFAFCPEHWLPGKIARAEAARDALPVELREEADAHIEPLRKIVAQ